MWIFSVSWMKSGSASTAHRGSEDEQVCGIPHHLSAKLDTYSVSLVSRAKSEASPACVATSCTCSCDGKKVHILFLLPVSAPLSLSTYFSHQCKKNKPTPMKLASCPIFGVNLTSGPWFRARVSGPTTGKTYNFSEQGAVREIHSLLWWGKKKTENHSVVSDFLWPPWTIQSMEFSRPEYWSG